MAIKQNEVTIRMLGYDTVNLGRSDIIEGSLLIDGRSVPTHLFTIDYMAGTIQRVGGTAVSRDRYEITYDYNEMVKGYEEIRRDRLRAAIPDTEAIVAIVDHLEGVSSIEYTRLVNLIADIRADVPPGTEEPIDFNSVV
jgi:hypothetical protein